MAALNRRFNFVELAGSVGASGGVAPQKMKWEHERLQPPLLVCCMVIRRSLMGLTCNL